jgi:hypothetical protein
MSKTNTQSLKPMKTTQKKNCVYANLYIDYAFPETLSNEEAQGLLEHMLRVFAIENPKLTIKLVKSPVVFTENETTYLP